MASQVDTEALTHYQQALDRIYERSHELMAEAPTWQAALYQSLRACYVEMAADRGLLQLHFITTGQDPAVQLIRGQHRDRLIELLGEVRDDAPSSPQGEVMLNMIHRAMRGQVLNSEVPPDMDTAENTFATLLFHYEDPASPQQGSGARR